MKVLRLAAIDVLRALHTRRWLAVPPVFFVAGWLGADNAAYSYATQQPRQANLWGAPLSMLTNNSAVIFAFVLGFVLVAGDLYVYDRSSGASAMTLIRSASRPQWWSAKVCALAPLALVFSTLALFAALLAGAIQLPLSLGWSPAAHIPWGRPGSAVYPASTAIPPPLFFVLVLVYIAVTLWAVGAVVLLVSTLSPRLLTPLAAGVAWSMAGSPLVAPLYSRAGIGTLDPIYQISYVIHFSKQQGFIPTSALISLAVVSATLLIATGGGAWRLHHTNL